MSYYENNIKFLPKEISEDLSKIPLKYNLERSKSGDFTLGIERDGSKIYLHSRYNPQREAFRFISSFNFEDKSLLIVFGFGLGYHIKEICRRIKNQKVVVIEPEIEIFKLGLSFQDLSSIFSFSQIDFIIGEFDKVKIYNHLSKHINLENMNKIQIIKYSPSLSLNPEYYQEITGIIKIILEMNKANLASFMNFGSIWQENILRNFWEIIENPPVDALFGKFTHIPAIIISAGPSLNKNIKYLKRAKKKAILISVDTALKPLLNEGILPDIVVSVDAQEANFKHFQEIETKEISLLADTSSYYQILRSFKGKKFLTSDKNSLIDWISNFIYYPDLKSNKISILRGGGSVSTVAFDLAIKMKAEPIIFVGQDFSYTQEGVYANETSYQKEWLLNINKFKTLEMFYREYILSRDLIPVYDIYGKKVYTNNILNSYCEWLKLEIVQSKTTCINATEGGILKDGVVIMPLEEAVKRYTKEEVNIEERLKECQNILPLLDRERMSSEIEYLIKEEEILKNLYLRNLDNLEKDFMIILEEIERFKIVSVIEDTLRGHRIYLSSKRNRKIEDIRRYFKKLEEATFNLVEHLKRIYSRLTDSRKLCSR